jgi:FkbM family methyltransferase
VRARQAWNDVVARYHLDVLATDPADFARRAVLFARRRYYRWRGLQVRRSLNGVTFRFDFTLPEHVDLMFLGIYEPELLPVLRRHLRPGGVFVDVGANVGYVSALAAGLVGPEGEVHAFEPVPRYFERLAHLPGDNPRHTIVVNRCALGERPDTLDIVVTGRRNMGANSMVAGLVDPAEAAEVVKVQIVRLDAYLAQHDIRRLGLVKVDTEGFEFHVLRGLEGFLRRTGRRPPLYVEITPAAYPLLGLRLDDLAALLRDYGYRATTTEGDAAVDVTALEQFTNVLLTPVAGAGARR